MSALPELVEFVLLVHRRHLHFLPHQFPLGSQRSSGTRRVLTGQPGHAYDHRPALTLLILSGCDCFKFA